MRGELYLNVAEPYVVCKVNPGSVRGKYGQPRRGAACKAVNQYAANQMRTVREVNQNRSSIREPQEPVLW